MSTNPFELSTSPLHIDAMELDRYGDGVPPYLVADLATQIVRLSIANGVDPHTAYFRGRQGQAENLIEVGHDIEAERRQDSWQNSDVPNPDDDYIDQQNPYDDILGEAAARQAAQQEALGRQLDGPPAPMYTLGTHDALFSDDTLSNPIHLAGISDESVIDVYDRNIVNGFAPGGEGLTKIASIHDNQLALAAIARIKLNYVIVGEDV